MVQLCSRCGAGGTMEPLRACTIVEGGACAACIESSAIYRQIRQLEKEIAILKAKRRVLATTINAKHDPFIHKLPPEIGSHIFRLCLPRSNPHIYDQYLPHMWEWNMPLKLGAVCRKWRQLAWATPNLWVTPLLNIKPSTPLSLAKSLPGLLREWLGRSGLLSLTIFFHHTGYSERPPSDYDLKKADEFRVLKLKTATYLVIEVIELYWGRLENLHLVLVPDVHASFSGSMQPNKITFLELKAPCGADERSPRLKFITASKPNPKYLILVGFPPTSIDIGWDNVTHAMLGRLYFSELVEVLQRAPALEYCHIFDEQEAWDIDDDTIIVHPRLRSLNTCYSSRDIFNVISFPSLEEWVHNMNMGNGQHDCASMISFLDRSNCFLKILDFQGDIPEDLPDFLQATPFLESLCLPFAFTVEDTAIMDDIFTRMSRSTPVSSVEGTASGSFLPHLQYIECGAIDDIFPFTWALIPQLYHQGHRRSLTLECRAGGAYESQISDETALELLQLVEEGVALQIYSRDEKDLLKKLRKKLRRKMRKRNQ